MSSDDLKASTESNVLERGAHRSDEVEELIACLR